MHIALTLKVIGYVESFHSSIGILALRAGSEFKGFAI